MDIEVETFFLVREHIEKQRLAFLGFDVVNCLEWNECAGTSDRTEILQQGPSTSPQHSQDATFVHVKRVQTFLLMVMSQRETKSLDKSLNKLEPIVRLWVLTINQGSVGDYKVPYCTYCCFYLWKKFIPAIPLKLCIYVYIDLVNNDQSPLDTL